MATLIGALRLLALVVWVGGIVFFAFVLAPVAFHLLPTTHMAGIVVGGTLRVLDVLGLSCGAIFLLSTTLLPRHSKSARSKAFAAQIIFVSAMMLGTVCLHFMILPAMEIDRAETGGDIEVAPLSSPARLHFEALHTSSERLEGAVLLCGLAVVVLISRESSMRDPVDL